jgi:hypothetical protein
MERFSSIPSDRDLSEDEKVFLEQMHTTPIGVLDVTMVERERVALSEAILDTKLFLIGETHGVKENVDMIYTLFKKFSLHQLALEWPPELSPVIDEFLETRVLNFKSIETSSDGRITAGHFALIQKLHHEGLLERVLCFDEGFREENSWNERDATMAECILRNRGTSATLVVAGNLHAKTSPLVIDDEQVLPMGAHIKGTVTNVPTATIQYLSGSFHNIGLREFHRTIPESPTPEPRCYRDQNGYYVFEIPVAHPAIVPNPHERI